MGLRVPVNDGEVPARSAGDREAFTAFYRRYEPYVRRGRLRRPLMRQPGRNSAGATLCLGTRSETLDRVRRVERWSCFF
jgi:hypothetical protein